MSGCTGTRPEGCKERLEEHDPCESAAAPCTGPAARRNGALAWFGDMIDHCYEYASAASAEGRPIVGIMCEYTPREIIMAAGAVPVCLCGGSAETIPAAEEELPSNLCPLIKSTYGFCLEKSNPFLEMASLVVAETTCDGKKKMFELLARAKPMHLIELTQKSDDPEAFAHWHAELGKLKAALERRFETTITDDALRAQIELMNKERALRRNLAVLMRRTRPPLAGRELLSLKTSIAAMPEALAQYARARKELEDVEGPPEMARRVRVLLTGVPVVHGAERVVELIESAGGLIAAMENCTGLKPILDDVAPNAPDPLRALAEKYYRLHCSVMTPNTRRQEFLRELARDYGVQCVIDLVWQACLTYDVEAALIRRFVEDELHLPYLRIETDYSPSDSARIQVRVEALYETVRRNAKGCTRA
jgi:benzoyl-CoA reductase/2-hydroxyglutaryl-CoA dehydratase subunit BcrC/BadD/HgdB